jgi:hypothetical protein
MHFEKPANYKAWFSAFAVRSPYVNNRDSYGDDDGERGLGRHPSQIDFRQAHGWKLKSKRSKKAGATSRQAPPRQA